MQRFVPYGRGVAVSGDVAEPHFMGGGPESGEKGVAIGAGVPEPEDAYDGEGGGLCHGNPSWRQRPRMRRSA